MTGTRVIGKLALWMTGVLTMAVLATGCGGGGSTEARSEPAPSRAAFVKRGNDICKKSGEERALVIGATIKRLSKSKDTRAAAQEELVTEALGPVEGMLEELDDLGTPAGDRGEVDAILHAFKAATSTITANPRAGLDGSPFKRPDQLAADYGLTSCVL